MITKRECDRRRALGHEAMIPGSSQTVYHREYLVKGFDAVWDQNMKCWLFPSIEACQEAVKYMNERKAVRPQNPIGRGYSGPGCHSDALEDLDAAIGRMMSDEWYDPETDSWVDC